jgi:hypothetical protein
MSQSLYTWIAAFNSLHVSNLSEFLNFCSSFSVCKGYFLCTRVAPLCSFNEIELLITTC